MSTTCDEKVQCVICDKILLFQEFKKHIKFIVNTKKKISIVTCETKYEESKIILQNSVTYDYQENEILACDVCDKTFYYFDNLKSHFEMVHERKKFYKLIEVGNVYIGHSQLSFIKLLYNETSCHFLRA